MEAGVYLAMIRARVTYGCIDDCNRHFLTILGRTLHALIRHHRWITGRVLEREFMAMWGELLTYNTEKGRGIVHDEETVARMSEQQAAYDKWITRRYLDD